MSYIHGVETALPAHRESKRAVQLACAEWLGEGTPEYGLFSRFHSASKVEHRHFALPLAEILAQKGMEVRSAIFEEEGIPLGSHALSAALQSSRLESKSLGALVFASCSVPVIPSIDARIALQIGSGYVEAA